MSTRKRQQLKNAIVDFVMRNGIDLRAERITNLMFIPQKVDIDELLAELVEEGRLIVSRYTLDQRGDVRQLYNVPQTQ